MKNRQMKNLFITALIVLSAVLIINSVIAKEGDDIVNPKLMVKDASARNNFVGRNTCSAVKKTIEEGLRARDVVQTGIESGHSPCLVIKCAVAGGGDLEEVIRGGLQAGVTSDVVSRCAIDAGADIKDVATTILRIGPLTLCYFPPQEGLGYSTAASEMIPMDSTSAVSAANTTFISPSSF